MPKKLNVDHLKEMAKHRPDIEEERLKNQTIELLGYDPTQKRPEKKQGTGKDYDIRGSFKLENIKEEEKREVFADDNFVTEKNKGKDGEKGDNVIDNREERTREKLFNPFSFSVGRDRDERIREAEERVNSAIGLNKKNHLPDVDQSGKQYIWNLPGADIAFRLEAGMNLARQVLTAMGPGKEKKLKEIEERYAKLKAKLNSPANKIKKEDNLSGYAGDGVILPSGLKIKGIFKDRVDRFEAVMLLDSITNSVSISENLHQQRLTEYTANSYNPSAISRAVENMQMICDYQDGNLLRGAGKNVAIKESIEKIQKFPENANLEELNKAFNNPDIQLEMTGYIVTGIEAKSAIDDEYRTANTQFVGPVPEVPKELEEPKKEEKKGREIAVADTKKKINFLGLRLSYKEFSEAMLKAGFDAGTTNAVFNIYNEEMVPYLDPVLGAEGNTVIDDEIQILALRGVVGNAGSVKGKLNKESLAHINSVIYRKTAKWEQEHGKKFETGDHSDYGFFGKGKKSEEEKLEFPWDETEEKKENKKKEKKEEIKDKEDKDKKEEGKENKEEKKEDKKEDKKEEGKNEEKKEETFDFEELVNDDYMQVFDEDDLEAVFNSFQLNKLNSEIDLYSTVEKVDGEITRFGSYLLHGQFKSKEEEEHMLEAYNNIGASKTRPAGILSLFTIWAMGELGHSYENAIRLLDKPDIGTEYLLSEFNKFCEENQVLNNEDNPEQFKKAVKNWTKLYKNATEKMKEYKIPDIDYFDKDALVKLQRELYMVSILGVNANQDQINPIFNEGKTITDTARNIAIEELGSEKAYMDMTTFWPNIQHVAGDYQSAYTQLASKVRTLKERKSVDYAKKVMCGKLYDYLLRTKLNMVRGKTFGEASEFFKIKGVLETETISNMISIDDAATEIPVQKFIDYGSGKNIKPLADEIQARKGKLYSSEKASRGVVIQKCLNDFRSNVNHNEAVAKAFLNAPDDAEGRREFLKKTDKNGVSYKTHITSLFAEITRPDCWNAITDTGYRVSGLFLIGGKTPEELWGRKYSHVENPEEKEWLLRSEIYKAAVSGDRDIQIRRFEIGADEKFKEKDIVTLLPSKHKAEKLINGIEHYKTAVQEAQYPLLSFKSIMSKYPDKKVQLAGLQKAVDRLSRTLDNSITGNDVSFETIKADFASLASAAGAYVMANQQDKSDVLYILANSVHGFVQQSSGIFNNIEKELSGNIIANSEHILNPPSFKWAEKAATEIENFYSKSISLNKETKHEVVQEIESVRNEIEKGNSFKAVQQKLVNGTNLTPDEVKVLNRKFDIIKQSEKTSELVALDQMKVMGGNEQETNVRSGIYKAAGFAGTRQDTMRSVYTLWLMGHKGYDLKSAIRILRSPDDVMINEFVQFCKDNPTNSLAAPGLKPDKYVAGAKKWAEVMKKSTELMKDYVIPDIDYSDPEAVREVFDEMEVIKGLSINAKQEFDRICDHEIPAGLGTDNVQYPGGTCREYVYEAIGGEPAYKEMTSIWRGSQSAYNAAYNAMHTATGAEYWNQGNAVMINRMLAGQAVNRYFLEKDFNKMKGMRFGDVPSSQIRITSMESDIREADIMAKIQFGEVNPDKEMVINYLTGKDKKAFESYIEKEFLNKKMEEAKKAVSPASVAQSFVRNVIRNSGQLVPLVSSLNDDKASKIEFAKNNKSIINGAFENIFTDASYRLAKEQGIDILDLVQIDGKTPEELWGETYKDINDPIERDIYIRQNF